MTTDDQRWAAIGFAEMFLESLSGLEGRPYPMKGLRIPKELRTMARGLLKHFPNDLWVEQMQEQAEAGGLCIVPRALVQACRSTAISLNDAKRARELDECLGVRP